MDKLKSVEQTQFSSNLIDLVKVEVSDSLKTEKITKNTKIQKYENTKIQTHKLI